MTNLPHRQAALTPAQAVSLSRIATEVRRDVHRIEAAHARVQAVALQLGRDERLLHAAARIADTAKVLADTAELIDPLAGGRR